MEETPPPPPPTLEQVGRAGKDCSGEDKHDLRLTTSPKCSLSIGEIKTADRVEGATKLLRLTVDIGEDTPRQILAGIAESYARRKACPAAKSSSSPILPRASCAASSLKACSWPPPTPKATRFCFTPPTLTRFCPAPRCADSGRRKGSHETLTRILLARHGETEWNKIGRVQGWTDIPLSAVGEAQAEALARRLREHARLTPCIPVISAGRRQTAEASARTHGLDGADAAGAAREGLRRLGGA